MSRCEHAALHEHAEVAWAQFLDRFDQQVYPVLFKPRGYTRAEALVVWQTSFVESELQALRQEMVEFREEMRA